MKIVEHKGTAVGEVVEIVHPSGTMYVGKHYEYEDVSPAYRDFNEAINWVGLHEWSIALSDNSLDGCVWFEDKFRGER